MILAQQADWSLLDPWFLGLLPVAAVLFIWHLRRRRAALPAAEVSLFRSLPKTLRSRLVQLPAVLTLLSVAALSVAMARPVSRDMLPLRELGVDIMLVLDISTSMETLDMGGDRRRRRMDAAREQALTFASARANDRVGLMTYAQFPELRCPLTLDQRALETFLLGVDIVSDQREDGTAIGVALAKAVSVLERSDAASKVVVLLTDGENTIDNIMPLDAGRMAVDSSVRVHTIGVGRGRRMPIVGTVPVDFSELEQIAEMTGGRFFAAPTEADLAEVYAAIDELEKVELEDPRYRTVDYFHVPLLLGVAFLLLGLLAEFLWIREAP